MNEGKDNRKTVSNWVHEYSDQLYSWAYHKTSSETVAQDLVQETFLSAFKSIDKFEERSTPKTWLTAILNNKIKNHYQKSMKEKTVFQSDSSFNSDGSWKNTEPSDIWNEEQHLLDNPEFNSTLDKCKNDLPEKWRLAIASKYTLNLNPEEICQELQISMSNYWQMIHRAKVHLKNCIEKNWA